MNTPGKAAGNWAWRVGDADVWQKLAPDAQALRRLAYVWDRLPRGQEVQLVSDAELAAEAAAAAAKAAADAKAAKPAAGGDKKAATAA